MERHRLKRRHTRSLCTAQDRYWLSTAAHRVGTHYAQRTCHRLSEEFLSPCGGEAQHAWLQTIILIARRRPTRTALQRSTLSKQEHLVRMQRAQAGKNASNPQRRTAWAATAWTWTAPAPLREALKCGPPLQRSQIDSYLYACRACRLAKTPSSSHGAQPGQRPPGYAPHQRRRLGR